MDDGAVASLIHYLFFFFDSLPLAYSPLSSLRLVRSVRYWGLHSFALNSF